MGTFIGVVAAFSLGLVGHGGSTTTGQIVQRFVCERSYTNFATGYQHSGIYVDRDGGVYRFDVQIAGYPRLPQGPDLTEAEMENKYGAERKLLRTVAAGELQAMFQLIRAAAKGHLSKKVSAARRSRRLGEFLLSLRQCREAISRSRARRGGGLDVPQPRAGGATTRGMAHDARPAG